LVGATGGLSTRANAGQARVDMPPVAPQDVINGF
jgi:hypothetical protein